MRAMQSLLFTTLFAAAAVVSAELIDGTKVVGTSSLPPAVAFVCGKPAMYQTEAGWQRDDNEFCLQTNDEILAYCKERYPNVEIVNVVPSPAETTITSWCNAGETVSCGNVTRPDDQDSDIYDESYDEFYGLNRTELERIRRTTVFNVRPFRCLVGPFQADALMIPDACKFSHIDSFETENCSTYAEWNNTASQQCTKSKMSLYSVAVLLPCAEPGKFSGSEFVCCPSSDAASAVASGAEIMDSEILADEDEEEDETGSEEEDCLDTADYYRVYESSPWVLGTSEHQRYDKARRCVLAFYTQRKEVLIRTMTTSSTNDTDALSRMEAESTFRKAYNELDEQWVAVRREMNALHQRRVQDELSTKSAAALDALDAELDEAADNDPHVDFNQVTRITSAMKNYISRVRKEQLHWVDRYEFLERHHPQQLAVMREQIRNYLLEIHLRLNRSLEMLKRVPEFEKPIRERITQYLSENSDVDTEVQILFPEGLAPAGVRDAIGNASVTPAPTTAQFVFSTQPQPASAVAIVGTDSDGDDLSLEDGLEIFDSSDVDESDLGDSAMLDLTSSKEDDDASAMELENESAIRGNEYLADVETSTRVIELDLPIDETEIDDSSSRETADMPDEVEASQLKALQAVLDGHPEVIIVDTSSNRLLNWSQLILLCVSVTAVLIILVIVIFVVRRSARARLMLRLKPQTSVVEIDSRGLLESEAERGLLGNMQSSGYENPTYAHYDKLAEH